MDDLKAPGDYTLVGGPFGSSLTTKHYVESPGVPVIRGGNLGGKESRWVEEDFVFVSETKAEDLRRNLAYPGDLIFTQRGTLGQVAEIPTDTRFPRFVVSQSQMKLTPDRDRISPRFLYYWFRSPLALAMLESTTQATGVPHINLGILKEFPVPLPPLPEQRRIAAILDKADAIRRKRRQAIELTEELLRSAFLEMFGDPVTNPKGWPVVKMGTLLAEAAYGTARKANEEGRGLPVLRMNNLTADGRVDLTALKWVELDGDDIPKFTVRRGDLMFNRTNSPKLVGKTAVWHSDEPYALAGYLVRVRFHEGKAEPEYVSSFLNSAYGKRYLFVKAKASNNMSNFSAGEFKKIPIPAPPIEVQQRFVAFATRVRTLRERLEGDATAADDLFHSLAQRAFRGEL